MLAKNLTPERSSERGRAYLIVLAACYLLSLLSLQFLPPGGYWNQAWAQSPSPAIVMAGDGARAGMVYGALILLGVWVCCGSGSGLLRRLCGAGIAVVLSWWLGLYTMSEIRSSIDYVAVWIISTTLLVHYVVVVVFAWVSRYLQAWPAPAPEAEPGEASFAQFALRDLFLLTTVSGMAIATLVQAAGRTEQDFRYFPGMEMAMFAAVHTVWQTPLLVLAAFAIYAAADPQLSLQRIAWVFVGLLVIGFIWVGLENSLARGHPNYIPLWAFALPAIYSYFFTIALVLLAARELGWLEVPEGSERVKPDPSRPLVAAGAGEREE